MIPSIALSPTIVDYLPHCLVFVLFACVFSVQSRPASNFSLPKDVVRSSGFAPLISHIDLICILVSLFMGQAHTYMHALSETIF